jgi:hypothetical protein
MTQEELLKVYLAEGYDEKYFSYFLEEWNANLDVITAGDEKRATELSFETMKEFMHQLSMGYSAEWAYAYAIQREDIDYPHDVLEEVSKIHKISEDDLMLFAKSQKQGEVFEKILIDIWNGEIVSKGLAYDQAVEYVQHHSDIHEEEFEGEEDPKLL